MLHILAQLESDFTTTTTSSSTGFNAGTIVFGLILLALCVFIIASMWKIFQKAGKPGWAAIIPVYNSWVLFEITGYPAWIALLSLVPFVSLVTSLVAIMANFKLAKLFGKSDFFAVMNVLFPVVTYPMLAGKNSHFQGIPVAAVTSNLSSFDPTNTGMPPTPPAAPTPPTPTDPTQPPVAPTPPTL